MIWADRASLAVALSIALVAALTALVLFVGVGLYDAARLYFTVALWAGIAEIAITVPLWALLRGIDILSGARGRRLRREAIEMEAPREPAALVTANQDLPQ